MGKKMWRENEVNYFSDIRKGAFPILQGAAAMT